MFMCEIIADTYFQRNENLSENGECAFIDVINVIARYLIEFVEKRYVLPGIASYLFLHLKCSSIRERWNVFDFSVITSI